MSDVRGVPATVTVVIPTRGRPRLVVRAVRSALDQTCPPHEVVVVVDGPDPSTEQALAGLDPRVVVVPLLSSGGAAAARNAGVARATGDLIAFLDDDDLWLPAKLQRQWAVLAAATDPWNTVVSTAAFWDTGDGATVWPTRSPRPGEPIAEYLFVRDHAGEGLLATPTILLPRTLAAAHPMDPTMRIHEDLDWFLRLEAAGASFVVLPQPLVRVDASSGRQSLSSQSTWSESLAWSVEHRARLGPRAFSGFVLTEAGRAAVRSDAPLGTRTAILRCAMGGRPRPRDVARYLALNAAPSRLRSWVHARRLGSTS